MKYKFVETDPKAIEQELIGFFEEENEVTLYPGDERRLMLKGMLPVFVALRHQINDSSNMNMLENARGVVLDFIGSTYYRTLRLLSQKALVTILFTLSMAQANNSVIPSGTRVTGDGKHYFITKDDVIIPPGELTGSVTAAAEESGSDYNDFSVGYINIITTPLPFVASVSNTDASTGGTEVESDIDYIERCKLAPEAFNTAGSEEAYKYHARQADASVKDVAIPDVVLGSATVKVVVLQENGQIPTTPILDRVLENLSAKDKRPLTDHVVVEAAEPVTYNIDMTYYIHASNQVDETKIRAAIEDSEGVKDSFIDWQHSKLKRHVNPDKLRSDMFAAGAFRIVLPEPAYTELLDNQVAKVGTVSLVYGGITE